MSNPSLLANVMKPIEQLFEVLTRCWHRIGELLFVVQPVAVMALQKGTDTVLRCRWLGHRWVEDNTGEKTQQSTRKHNALPSSRHKYSFACLVMLNQAVLNA